ncbi:LysR family transcriptional regulator [Acidisoma cellulosilytica]|uniref:LysR family transcriptional regulator n=1 Tax=Acidisoma cellulosilyticum TaxID=2802395 RepID=A0A963YYI6_9PROT|nr:LysR family transcriptional regulator [Acidisoma cellulosilyticum]MCB8879325.1 LysR family transcriptional regulator [Acidisoma cellulosilyticum]
MLDRLTSMTVFLRAVDLGSFAAAGAALGLSPQMVAKHVVALEDRLGARLLQRTTRKHSLTEVGRAYADRCRTILAEVEEAETLAQTARLSPRGKLRVNAPVTFGAQMLTPLVTRFLRQHPEVEVELTLTDRLVDPIEDGFEAIIRLGPIGDSRLIARPLAPYRLIACASPAYLAARGTPQTPADLARHECLGFAFWTSGLGRQWQFRRDGQSFDVPVSGRLKVNDWKGLLAAALDGFGITLGPESALTQELAEGRLIQLLPDYEGPLRPMHLLYAADRRMTPKLRLFIDAVIAEFGSGLPSRPSPSRAVLS